MVQRSSSGNTDAGTCSGDFRTRTLTGKGFPPSPSRFDGISQAQGLTYRCPWKDIPRASRLNGIAPLPFQTAIRHDLHSGHCFWPRQLGMAEDVGRWSSKGGSQMLKDTRRTRAGHIQQYQVHTYSRCPKQDQRPLSVGSRWCQTSPACNYPAYIPTTGWPLRNRQ